MTLIGNVIKPLVISFLVSLDLIAAALATDAVTHKKIFRSVFTKVIISNEKMNKIMRIVK